MRRIKAFTLIELLVVISIIGILIGVTVFGMDSYFKSARDTQRKSDLKQYQTSLETYANKNNSVYPVAATAVNPAGTAICVNALGLSGCPDDPDTSVHYRYQTNASGTSYFLWATLEDPSSPTTYWVLCSNGKSAASTTAPSGSCPLP